jgi:UDP-glucose 4-epimerase
VFVSSIKVNGEQTTDQPYRASDEPRPLDVYGQSKKVAEDHLREVSRVEGLEFSIVRPPLVHGPGVRANFLRLLRWVDAEKLVPLGSVDNRRSLVGVWNLADLLVNLLVNPAAKNSTWLVSDGRDLSTPDLIRQLAAAMGRRPRLLPVPVSLLRVAGALTGKSAEIQRVCSSLCVDVETTCKKLGWKQPLTSEEALARTAKWYVSSKGASGVG